MLREIQFHTVLAEIQSFKWKENVFIITIKCGDVFYYTSGEASFLTEAFESEVDFSEVLLALDLTEILLELFLVPDEADWPEMLAVSRLSSG